MIIPPRQPRAAGRWTALLAACLASGLVTAQTLPTRKPGLWEVTVQSRDAPPVRSRQCIDAETDGKMQQMGQGMAQSACSKNVVRREGGNWVSETVCNLGGSTITSRGVISGDFQREVRMVIDAQYSPPMMGMSQSQTTVTQRHAGDCPAGWRPGDMELPGSQQRMNVTQLPGAVAPKR